MATLVKSFAIQGIDAYPGKTSGVSRPYENLTIMKRY